MTPEGSGPLLDAVVRKTATSRNPGIRLVVIPVLIYIAWLLDTWLLDGRVNLFSHIDPSGLLLYTAISCILIGIIVPILWIRVSFIAGVVNMFQIGFRSVRRTLVACSGTLLAGYIILVIANPFGTDRAAFFNAFFLMLPTAIASVMICWTLVGTHIQAFVREGGALISIHVGVAVTTLAFGLSGLVYAPGPQYQEALFWFACIGIISALFFFAVRDIYATIIVVAGMMVFALANRIDTVFLHGLEPVVYVSAAIAVTSLASVHVYFSRNFTTIIVPEELP